MTLKELAEKSLEVIKDFKDFGYSPKENNLFDYKMMLVINSGDSEVETFMKNFSKDIISFANGRGGTILIGFNEDKTSGELEDTGLKTQDLEILKKTRFKLSFTKIQKNITNWSFIRPSIFSNNYKKILFITYSEIE